MLHPNDIIIMVLYFFGFGFWSLALVLDDNNVWTKIILNVVAGVIAVIVLFLLFL